MKSAKVIADLMGFFAQVIQKVFEAARQYGQTQDARAFEACVQEQVYALGAVLLEAAWRLRMQEVDLPSSRPCGCGRRMHKVGRRSRTVRGVMGEYELDERYYYRCDQCGKDAYVGDELRGDTDFTPLAEERIALAGKEMPFQKAADFLKRAGIVRVASSTVRKVCVRLGRRIREMRDREAVEQYGASGPQREERAERLAIGTDGTMMGRVDPQHRKRRSRTTGRKVRGKGRLHHFFHEVKTLVVFDFDRTGKAIRKTYLATQERVEAFREKVAVEGRKRGAETAKVLVFLGDGAAWVWKTAREVFPRAIEVLDWYHAMEHLWAVGRARFGTAEGAAEAWVREQAEHLWEGRVETVIEAIRTISAELGAPDEGVREEARERDPRWVAYRNIGYFTENRGRMDYPRYREEGLPIASGVIESSCKHVVADRMKRTGMRWDEEAAEDVLALRCLDLNDRWDALWPVKRAG